MPLLFSPYPSSHFSCLFTVIYPDAIFKIVLDKACAILFIAEPTLTHYYLDNILFLVKRRCTYTQEICNTILG